MGTRFASFMGAITLAALAGGCAVASDKQSLLQAREAFDQKDYPTAITRADLYIEKNPGSPSASEAFYIKGRAQESRVATSRAEAQSNLRAARLSYQQALALDPTGLTGAYVRCGLANVSFHLEDYTTAISQWQSAYTWLDRTDLKAWTLFQIGTAYQRLGRSQEADATFARVAREFPGTQAAQRAVQRQGARAFFVQLGAFADPNSAATTVTRLRGMGLLPQQTTDAAGRAIVRIGPWPTWPAARQQQSRFAGEFPDAFILP